MRTPARPHSFVTRLLMLAALGAGTAQAGTVTVFCEHQHKWALSLNLTLFDDIVFAGSGGTSSTPTITRSPATLTPPPEFSRVIFPLSELSMALAASRPTAGKEFWRNTRMSSLAAVKIPLPAPSFTASANIFSAF